MSRIGNPGSTISSFFQHPLISLIFFQPNPNAYPSTPASSSMARIDGPPAAIGHPTTGNFIACMNARLPRDIVDQHHSRSIAIECLNYRLEALLTGGIPDLKLHAIVLIDGDGLGGEVHT